MDAQIHALASRSHQRPETKLEYAARHPQYDLS